MSFVNPYSCLGLFDVVTSAEGKCVIQSAACSALGLMMDKYFRDNGLTVINIVRRQGQVDILKARGSPHILNTAEESFAADLKKACQELQPSHFLDAVGGELTGTVLNAMPNNSTAVVYGLLSNEPCSNISGTSLVFQGKTVTGFILNQFMAKVVGNGTIGDVVKKCT